MATDNWLQPVRVYLWTACAWQAVELASAPGNVVLLQASRFRGGATPVLVRRIVAAQAATRTAMGSEASDPSYPQAVISAQESTAELLSSFVRSSAPNEGRAFVGADTDDITLAMVAAYRGQASPLTSVQD
eukprot:scaffold272358_cov32-Prasinocladus_malaysianus.AAC.1